MKGTAEDFAEQRDTTVANDDDIYDDDDGGVK